MVVSAYWPIPHPRPAGRHGKCSGGRTDLTQVQQEEIGSTTNNAYITNTYDPNNGALADSKIQNTTASPTVIYDDTSYTYDKSGNVTAETDTHNGTQSETQCFAYDTLDRLTQAWTATDNCAADPSADSGATVGDGIPGSAYWTSWAYNPLGDRTSQTQHATTSGGTSTTTYHYGNPRGTAPSSWPDINAFLGKPADTATGLDIIGARNYDPALGRFISIDPILEQTSPQQLNGYSYAADNPVTNTDPTGLNTCDQWGNCTEGGGPTHVTPPSLGGPSHQTGPGYNSGSGGADPCPDWAPGCPGFTGGGAGSEYGSSGEPEYGPGYYRYFAYPAQQKETAASFSHGTASAPTCIMGAASRFDRIPGCSQMPTGSGGFNPFRWLGDHFYLQLSGCIVFCASLTFQGGHFILGVQGFTVTRPNPVLEYEPAGSGYNEPLIAKNARFKPSLFAGFSVGIDTATPREAIQSNVAGSASVADGLAGGTVGAMGYVGPNGLGPLRPYGGYTAGAGWQVTAGPSQSWDLNNGVAWLWDRIFGKL